MDIETETTNNAEYYKYKEATIKSKNINLWSSINNIKLNISFKAKFYLFENSIQYIPLCECGKDLEFTDMNKGFRKFCSRRCMLDSEITKEKRKNTCVYKYGVDNPSKSKEIKDKVIETNNIKFGVDYPLQSKEILDMNRTYFLEKYGVDNPSKLKETRLKATNTMLEKYGVEHAMQNIDIKKELRMCFISKYGVDNPSKLKETRLKATNTMLEKYGVEHAMQNIDILNRMKSTNLLKYGKEFFTQTDGYKVVIDKLVFRKISNLVNTEIYSLNNTTETEYNIHCSKCNNNFVIQRQLWRKRNRNKEEICLNCNSIYNNKSKAECEIFDFISNEYNSVIERNIRFDNKEIDIYIPELNLGFEFNGLFWHSELFKPKKYHYDKSLHFNKMGIKLNHIWEDDWKYKKDIIKSIILNKLGKNTRKIFARKCQVREITDNKQIRCFLEDNHIQGFIGAKIKLGLFYGSELVSLMTFGNLRKSLGQKSEEGSYELLRFCNVLNTSVIGGASKLFQYFNRNYRYNNIISYSDISRSDGNLYKILGFNLDKETDINYYWCKNSIRYHRFNFRKDKLIKEGNDITKTESEIMYAKDYYKIFDCGHQKWLYRKNWKKNFYI